MTIETKAPPQECNMDERYKAALDELERIIGWRVEKHRSWVILPNAAVTERLVGEAILQEAECILSILRMCKREAKQ